MAKTADRKLEVAQRIKELACDEHGLDPRGADLRRPHLHADHGRRRVEAERDRDDRGHPPHQGRAARRQDVARRLQRLLRRLAAGARGPELGLPAPLRGGRARPGDGQPQPHHALLRRSPTRSASSPTTSCSTAARTRCERFIEHFESQGEEAEAEAENPTEGMEPEEALHWHILRRKKEGVEDWIDRSSREDRRRPHPQRGPAAGDEGGRRQVRRRRAHPALRPPVGRGHEARGGAAGEVPRPHRGPHEGHRRDRDGVRRRARHRQVARQHDPHQQRLHGGRPGQAGPDLEHPRGRRRARGDGDRPERAARLDLQADAAVHPGAAPARAGVPGADRRRGDQPRLRPAHAVPEGQGVRRGLRARASSTARTPSPAWP